MYLISIFLVNLSCGTCLRDSETACGGRCGKMYFFSFFLSTSPAVPSTETERQHAGNSAAMVFKHYREIVREADARAYSAVAPTPAENITPIRKTA